MSINSTINEISKIDPNKFQTITIDKNHCIQVSDLADGSALYARGHRTNVDHLASHILTVISDETLGNDTRFEALALIKIFSSLIKNQHVETSATTGHSLQALNQRKIELKTTLAKDVQPLTPETLHNVAPPVQSKEWAAPDNTEGMTTKEKVTQNFYLKTCEGYRKVRADFKAIEAATRTPAPDSSRAEQFTYDRHDNGMVHRDVFEAYRLSETQAFLVHATSLSRVNPMIDTLQSGPSSQPNMCASLLGALTHFFGSTYPDRAALILAIDPRQIVLTSSHDIYSPTAKKGKAIYDFYNTHERVLLLAHRIDEIYQSSDLAHHYDQFIRIKNAFARTLAELVNLDKLLRSGELSRDEYNEKAVVVCKKLKTLDKICNQYDTDCGFRKESQIEQLKHYYRLNDETNHSPDEFKRVFRYDGSDIMEELREYDRVAPPAMFPHPLQQPQTLLANTPPKQHNEINVKLNARGTRPAELKGLVLTRQVLNHYTNGKKRVHGHASEAFSGLIQRAKESNMPIYILESKAQAKL